MRAWDVEWGSAVGRVVVENGYADVRETTITSGDSTITADGRFSLGFPRRDGGEEVNAQVRLTRRPIKDLRHAFLLDRYPHRRSAVRRVSRLRQLQDAVRLRDAGAGRRRAYGESFDAAKASVGLEGKGVRLTGVELAKGGGRGSGAAYVDWDGGYSFDFAGQRRFRVESVTLARRAQLPLSGLIDFTAVASGTFDDAPLQRSKAPSATSSSPTKASVRSTSGISAVIGDTMTIEAEVASPRLDVGVLGRVELTGGMYADVTFTVNDTSLDPYVRALNPRLSPFTTAVVDGTRSRRGRAGQLRTALKIDTQVRRLALRLFDYPLENSSPFNIALERRLGRGSPTRCTWSTRERKTQTSRLPAVSDLDKETIDMVVKGTANLAVLQGFVDNIESSGTSDVVRPAQGAAARSGGERHVGMDNGRIRHYGAPHGAREHQRRDHV